MAVEVVADPHLVPAVIGDLGTESNGHAVRRPALGGLADRSLTDIERHEVISGCARFEIDVVGDRQLGDPALDRLGGVCVDRDVAVGREIRVEMGIER